jgi:hypothetical protein
MTTKRFESFAEFWPFYVREHQNPINRALHFTGSTLGLLVGGTGLVTGQLYLLPVALGIGYGFAWTGHFVFEKNKPATFKHPFYSFLADWVMWQKILRGQMGREVERYAPAEPRIEAMAN